MFLAALFMLAENLWYIHAVDYYSAMERSKLSIQATPRMNLRDATLDERDLSPLSPKVPLLGSFLFSIVALVVVAGPWGFVCYRSLLWQTLFFVPTSEAFLVQSLNEVHKAISMLI